MAKINISIDDDVLARVNAFTDKNHISRSGLLSMSVIQYMDAVEALPGLKTQLDDLKKALDDMAVVR